MARATMATLITRLRRAVGDPSGASQTFTDDELQDFLDNHRVDVRTAELIPVTSVAAGGASSYLEFMAPRGFWEDDPTIQSNTYEALAPDTSDTLVGRWIFATSQTPPLFISGQSFDLWGAAIEVLEAWLGKVKAEFDFAADGQRFDRSQKATGIERLIASYRRRARSYSGTRLVTSRWDF